MPEESEQQDKPTTQRIVVVVYDPHKQRAVKKAFEGRFIIGDQEYSETFISEDTSLPAQGLECAVAVTKAGRIVLLIFSEKDGTVLNMNVFENFKELTGGDTPYPESLIQAIAAELGIDYVE